MARNELISGLRSHFGDKAFEWPSGLARMELLMTQGTPRAIPFVTALVQEMLQSGKVKELNGIFRDDRLTTSSGWVAIVGNLTRTCIEQGLAGQVLAVAQSLRGEVGQEIASVLRLHTPVDRTQKKPGNAQSSGMASAGQSIPMPASAQPPAQPVLPQPPPNQQPSAGSQGQGRLPFPPQPSAMPSPTKSRKKTP